MSNPLELNTMKATAEFLANIRRRIYCIPTMGNLHVGHRALVERAKADCKASGEDGCIIVTLFVNRRQFNRDSDFASYPRTYKQDLALLTSWGGIDAVFAPREEEFFPRELSTHVKVGGQLTECLCGMTRPGHFDGVALVVTKLLLAVCAKEAYFGLKDYQQWLVIRRLVLDLNIQVKLHGVATSRDAKGLAYSSRLRLLSEEGRNKAQGIYPVLRQACIQYQKRPKASAAILSQARQSLAQFVDEIDYLEFRDQDDLTTHSRTPRLFVAASIEGVRLIDNVHALS